jgi:hypothetical protein
LEAVSYLNSCKRDNEEANKLKVVCIQNLAICLNNTGRHGEAVKHCSHAIELDPKAVKALF